MGHKAIPPTSFYLSKRSEMFADYAKRALVKNNKIEYRSNMLKAIEYYERAAQLPLDNCISCDVSMGAEGHIDDDIPLCHYCYELVYTREEKNEKI